MSFDTPNKLSVVVLCYNQEARIEACLKSVSWADEVLVVDSYSTDRTMEIAQKYAIRVLTHEYVNYATQNNWAIPQAQHEWILIVDSDEIVSEQLQREIIELMKTDPKKDGYWIGRRNYLFGKEVFHSGWGNDRVLRLFRKGMGKYKDKNVHSRVHIQNTGNLNGFVDHVSITSITDWVNKINKYSTWKAREKYEKHEIKTPLVHVFLRPPARFLKDLILRIGILDGWRGVLIASMSAFAEFLMAAKLLHFHHQETGEETKSGSPFSLERMVKN